MKQFQTIFAVIAVMIILVLFFVFDPFGVVGSENHQYASQVIFQPNPGPDWDAQLVTSPTVLYDSSERIFKLWYVGNGVFERSGIGYATSDDGVRWTLNDATPLLEADPIDPSIAKEHVWDAGGIRSATVLKDGGFYKMWYSAQEWEGEGLIRIGYAESRDGIHWSKYAGNPVFSPVDGAWDSSAVTEPFVLKTPAGYSLWYTGIPKNTNGSASDISAIGYATSRSGKDFERVQSTPVVQGQKGEWNADRVSGPSVIRQETGLYEMWYSGSRGNDNSKLGRAYSSDGIVWSYDEDSPQVEDDADAFTEPFVGNIDEQYYLWLTRFDKKSISKYSLEFTIWPSDDPADTSYFPNAVPPLVQ